MLFLLGVVFAYLLGSQAQQYGANIFVVDGLLLAILREISPVIVAVLVAGRTGAAITAQIGTMKVTEEIDAITTLGLSPLAVLVIPRVLALLLALPLLVFIGDIAGILGGMLVTQEQLDISYHMFMDRVVDVLLLKTLLVGAGQGAGVRHLHRADRLPHGAVGHPRLRAAWARTPPPPWCRAWSPSSFSTRFLP